MPYLHVMAEIPQFVYYLTITPQNSTPAKNTPEVWEYGIFYGHTFILLLMYHNSKNSPVCGLCCGISFTCEMRLCTVNIPQSLTNTNYTKPYSTVRYRTVTESNFICCTYSLHTYVRLSVDCRSKTWKNAKYNKKQSKDTIGS